MNAKLVSKHEVQALLNDLVDWDVVVSNDDNQSKQSLHRVYEFESFDAAFSFMQLAAINVFSELDHHPKWLNDYKRLEIWLSTTSLNYQISNLDIKSAKLLEAIWA